MTMGDEGVLGYQATLPLAHRAAGDGDGHRLPPTARKGLLVLAVLALVASVAVLAWGGWHVAQMPDSEVRFASAEAGRTWDQHFAVQRTLSRLGFLGIMAALGLIAIARWERTVALLHAFWYAVTHPMNLAIYRVVLFATILFNLDNDSGYTQILFFAGLPKDLMIPPTGMEFILPWLPINPDIAWWALTLMNVFCVTAILGFFSRTSAWLVVLFGLYATGIPQYFGQTNHYHHMFWFAAVVAASPIGDYLSVDALIRARRRAVASGVTEPPPRGRAFALPLRFVWILIAICYFFPGLWKYWVSGLAWAFTDNFKHLMEWKWINMGQDFSKWQPLIRLDRYPWMYKPSALIAIVFEISFLFLIFFPRGRYLVAIMGVMFHRMTWFMMKIPFYTLQTSYVTFFEWDRIFNWLGHKMFPQPLTLAYDGSNVRAARAVATLRIIDLLNRVDWVNANDPAQAERLAAAGVGAFDAAAGAQATVGGETFLGAAALRKAAARNPLLWVVWPAVYLIQDPRKAAHHPVEPGAARYFLNFTANRGLTPVLVTMAIVLLPNLVLGVRRQYHAWPYSCYPLFEKIRTHVKDELEVKAYDARGQQIWWDEKQMMEILTKPRYSTMCRRLREANEERWPDARERLHAFVEMLVVNNPQLKEAATIKIFDRQIYSAVERWNEPPLSEREVFAAAIKDDGGQIVPQVRVTDAGAEGVDD